MYIDLIKSYHLNQRIDYNNIAMRFLVLQVSSPNVLSQWVERKPKTKPKQNKNKTQLCNCNLQGKEGGKPKVQTFIYCYFKSWVISKDEKSRLEKDISSSTCKAVELRGTGPLWRANAAKTLHWVHEDEDGESQRTTLELARNSHPSIFFLDELGHEWMQMIGNLIT